MQLNDAQRDFVAAIQDFCARECGTAEQRAVLTRGGETEHNPDLYARMADLGWLGVGIPEQYGGAGGGMVDVCLFLEHTAQGMAPVHAFGSTMICAGPYARFGDEDQKREVLAGIASGRVEAIAMSEPEAGSDAAAIRCGATREGPVFRVDGQKTWISNAHIADHILLICRTGRGGSRHEGLTMLMVPADQPGMEIRPIDTMGGRDEVNDVFFTASEVDADRVVGEEGQAWAQLTTGLNLERLIIAAECLGMAQRAFDDALSCVRERKQFGRAIGTFQALGHRISDLATELECTRLLVYEVATKVDREPDHLLPREASMAKLKASELARRCSLEGMQMMGGYGYATEYDMERHVRRSIVTTIYGGTSEIQREIIAKTFGLDAPKAPA
jgi:isovaleryl-CoA dehydrogenase